MNSCYPYSEKDQHTWQGFFAAMDQLWTTGSPTIHPWYRDHIKKLDCFRKQIPSIEELNEVLRAIGWQAQYVRGLAPSWQIARLLHRQILPISQRIRPPEEIFFANEPDLIHDIFGHLPSLFEPDYRRLLTLWASAAASCPVSEMDRASYHLNKQIVQSEGRLSGETQEHLHNAAAELDQFISLYPSPVMVFEKIYFWIFEFGIIQTDRDYQVLGAGLLSSLKELKKIATSQIASKQLNTANILSHYHISDIQEAYLTVYKTTEYEDLIRHIMSQVLPSAPTDTAMCSHG